MVYSYDTSKSGKYVIRDADNFWDFCNHLVEIARNERNVKEIVWHHCTEPLTSGVEFHFDEEDDEYMLVGFVTNNKNVYAEIDDGTYGNLQGLRVYTGRKAEGVEQ